MMLLIIQSNLKPHERDVIILCIEKDLSVKHLFNDKMS